MTGIRANDQEPQTRSMLAPGDNCWKSAQAERFAWLIDGDAYFRAVRASLQAARHEILIIGWDIDSAVELIRDKDHPHYPSPLARTLEALVDNNDELQVYVLSWDFAMLYMLERELLPASRFGWTDRRRLHFHLDDRHAMGASHHQKLVIIDGAVAYIGGLDLTKNRWDTREHCADDPRRTNPAGEQYRPFHDVQAVVSGEPARYLRQLAEFRWENATGHALAELDAAAVSTDSPAWPEDVEVRARDVTVGLARTWASPDGQQQVREVEKLYRDMIAASRNSIYIENQYFTSHTITGYLCDSLEAERGPEIVMVLPGETSGWLEQATMEVLRDRALARLQEADRHGRFTAVAPVCDTLVGTSINVHSKIMTVDDGRLRIGSANLSGRSMGLDSECDLVVEDPSGTLGAELRNDLLSEHLGTEPGRIAAACEEGGIRRVLETCNDGDRRLEPVRIGAGQWSDTLEPLAQVVDVDSPIERAWNRFVEPGHEPPEKAPATDGGAGAATVAAGLRSASLKGWGFLLLLLAAILWAVWQTRGSNAVLDPGLLLATLRESAAHPLAPLAVIPAFIAGSLVIAPVTGMIGLSALLFDPWIATLTATGGTLAATAVNYAIARRFGDTVLAYAPDRITTTMRRLARSSDAWSLAGLRLIPMAPFTVFNVVAGACGVRLRDLLLGTLIGMGPGIMLICFTLDRARAALSGEPILEPWIVATMIAAGLALVVMRVLQKRRSR